ncbi:MAG: biopolymer transporter ExbD [Hoeflea sp.]|uniref:ExbD/TolR family protein n=1 Tax=Hoeflea sp. TaxID=1940281 RepID=UPI0032EC9A97
MHIEAPRFERRRLALTPLIDIIFLLLLFFMLSSTFSRFTEVPVQGGVAGAGRGERPDVLISVSSGSVRLNGVEIAVEGIHGRLEELIRLGAERAMITVGGDATSQTLVDVLDAASGANIEVSVARSNQ